MTTGVAGIREKNFHSKKRMETAQKVSVIQSYFLLAPYHIYIYMYHITGYPYTSKLSCCSGKKIVKITACPFLALLFGKFASCCILGSSHFGVVAF